MSYFLKMFIPKSSNLHIIEFGHSKLKTPKTVGPWSREIYILHYIKKGFCQFSGFKAEAGQAFLISKERKHSFTVSEDYEHYWIGFSGDVVETVFESFGLISTIHQLFFVENKEFAESLFDLVLKELKNEYTVNKESVVLSLLNSLLPLCRADSRRQRRHMAHGNVLL